jgi:hypothetical protein
MTESRQKWFVADPASPANPEVVTLTHSSPDARPSTSHRKQPAATFLSNLFLSVVTYVLIGGLGWLAHGWFQPMDFSNAKAEMERLGLLNEAEQLGEIGQVCPNQIKAKRACRLVFLDGRQRPMLSEARN